jgi:hypothetical protein
MPASIGTDVRSQRTMVHFGLHLEHLAGFTTVDSSQLQILRRPRIWGDSEHSRHNGLAVVAAKRHRYSQVL